MLRTFVHLFSEQLNAILSTLQPLSYSFSANCLVFLVKVFQVRISLQRTL
jgi:hypothetical protein